MSTCIIMYVHEHWFLFKIVYETKKTFPCIQLHVEMFLIFETIIMPSINASQSHYILISTCRRTIELPGLYLNSYSQL